MPQGPALLFFFTLTPFPDPSLVSLHRSRVGCNYKNVFGEPVAPLYETMTLQDVCPPQCFWGNAPGHKYRCLMIPISFDSTFWFEKNQHGVDAWHVFGMYFTRKWLIQMCKNRGLNQLRLLQVSNQWYFYIYINWANQSCIEKGDVMTFQ